jgi:hypothetical protein
VHRRLEQAVAALAVAVGDVHRRVGVAEQLVGVGGAAALDHRDAEARAQRQLLAAHGQRPGQAGEDALGRVGDLLCSLDVLEEDRELVAAEARRGVARAHARGQALGDLDENLVAGRVAERVVDRLGVVQVGEQHGDPAPLRGGSARPHGARARRTARGWRGR